MKCRHCTSTCTFWVCISLFVVQRYYKNKHYINNIFRHFSNNWSACTPCTTWTHKSCGDIMNNHIQINVTVFFWFSIELYICVNTVFSHLTFKSRDLVNKYTMLYYYYYYYYNNYYYYYYYFWFFLWLGSVLPRAPWFTSPLTTVWRRVACLWQMKWR